MAIRAKCGSCNSSFNARDELAGKKVKCPKCKSSMVIGDKPQGKTPAPASRKPAKPKKAAIDPMEALLAEANIGQEASQSGPICPNCASYVAPGSVLCIDCGFNLETGKQVRTDLAKGESGGLTDAEKMMKQAEKDLDETPVGSEDQDFGDGGESFVIAGVAMFILAILVVSGVVIILSMDQISKYINSGGISFIGSSVIWISMMFWLTTIAFKASQGHGIACLVSLGLYCPIFGFMQGKSLLIPSIIMLISIVVGVATGFYVYYNGFGPPPN